MSAEDRPRIDRTGHGINEAPTSHKPNSGIGPGQPVPPDGRIAGFGKQGLETRDVDPSDSSEFNDAFGLEIRESPADRLKRQPEEVGRFFPGNW